jgi:hypothetical protein
MQVYKYMITIIDINFCETFYTLTSENKLLRFTL